MSDWIKKVDFEKISPDFPCGFEGFLPIRALVESKCAEIPEKQGVYLILTRNTQMPGFNSDNPVFASGKISARTVEDLQKQWNNFTHVLYIGKAGGPRFSTTLRERLEPYLIDWFDGRYSGHRGGRDIWQIDTPGDLLAAWRVTEDEDPESCEKDLLYKFTDKYGKFPFANHRH